MSQLTLHLRLRWLSPGPAWCTSEVYVESRGLCAGLKASMGEAGGSRMLLSLDYEPADAAAEAALAFAGPCQAISLGIEVEPSTEPASLVLLHHGELLPQKPLVCCGSFPLPFHICHL